jgi:hypothetical protein
MHANSVPPTRDPVIDELEKCVKRQLQFFDWGDISNMLSVPGVQETKSQAKIVKLYQHMLRVGEIHAAYGWHYLAQSDRIKRQMSFADMVQIRSNTTIFLELCRQIDEVESVHYQWDIISCIVGRSPPEAVVRQSLVVVRSSGCSVSDEGNPLLAYLKLAFLKNVKNSTVRNTHLKACVHAFSGPRITVPNVPSQEIAGYRSVPFEDMPTKAPNDTSGLIFVSLWTALMIQMICTLGWVNREDQNDIIKSYSKASLVGFKTIIAKIPSITFAEAYQVVKQFGLIIWLSQTTSPQEIWEGRKCGKLSTETQWVQELSTSVLKAIPIGDIETEKGGRTPLGSKTTRTVAARKRQKKPLTSDEESSDDESSDEIPTTRSTGNKTLSHPAALRIVQKLVNTGKTPRHVNPYPKPVPPDPMERERVDDFYCSADSLISDPEGE